MSETRWDYEGFSNKIDWFHFLATKILGSSFLPILFNCLPLTCRRRWILASRASQTWMSPFIFEGLHLTPLPLTRVSFILLEILKRNQAERASLEESHYFFMKTHYGR